MEKHEENEKYYLIIFIALDSFFIPENRCRLIDGKQPENGSTLKFPQEKWLK